MKSMQINLSEPSTTAPAPWLNPAELCQPLTSQSVARTEPWMLCLYK